MDKKCKKRSSSSEILSFSFSNSRFLEESPLKKIEQLIRLFYGNGLFSQNANYFIANRREWNNVQFCKEKGLQIKRTCMIMKRVSQTRRLQVLLMLGKLYEMLKQDVFKTKRNLYYEETNAFIGQRSCDELIDDICVLLECNRVNLHVLSTSKGLIGGNLMLEFDEYEYSCRAHSKGLLIPSNLEDLKKIHSDAQCILLIEKDAIFQQLILKPELASRQILITGKGYPDLNTRRLLCILHQKLQLPVYALVDADIFGIEIFCIYKFGSLSLAYDASQLTTKDILWLGLLPTDLHHFDLMDQSTSFRKSDFKKADSLLNRPYLADHPEIKKQITYLKTLGRRAGLQALNKRAKFGCDFILKYIFNKITTHQYV